MAKYKVLSGVYYENGVSHYPGDVVETDKDLLSSPPNKYKFAEVGSDAEVTDRSKVDDNPPTEDPAPTQLTNWHDIEVTAEELDLGKNITDALLNHETPVKTLGDLLDEYEKAEGLQHINGIAEASENTLLDLLSKYED